MKTWSRVQPKQCPTCKLMFKPSKKRVICCSVSCATTLRATKPPRKGAFVSGEQRVYSLKCRTCKQVFTSPASVKAFCNPCDSARTCRQCGKSISGAPPRYKYCSQSCSASWRIAQGDLKGKLTGKHLRLPGNMAKRNVALRAALRLRRGENSPNWKPEAAGRRRVLERNQVEYKEWRRAVFVRDKFTCQHCGAMGKIIQAHHVIGWAEDESKRYDVVNGLTLCVPCHRKVHSRPA